MSDLIRDAPIGQLIRFVTKNKLLKYPEEYEDFKCPHSYTKPGDSNDTGDAGDHIEIEKLPTATEPTIDEDRVFEEVEAPQSRASSTTEELEKIPTAAQEEGHLEGIHAQKTTRSQIERVGTRGALQRSRTQAELEAQFTLALQEKGPSVPVLPEVLEDGTILVDWYTTDDPANPQNWTLKKKCFVTWQICMYTLAVYMGSSIYAPGEQGVMEEFGVGVQVASLGLSMYVLAYGMGPLIWSPLSEIPAIGRNPPYMITFALFVILTVPTALAKNIGGLIVLRFLQGFFGSPCLATGGATLQDMFSLIKLPYVLSLWALSATCGPALGPIISGFSVVAESWRWSIWEMIWLAGPIYIIMFFFLPETSPSNILLRRAQRLRLSSGNMNLKAQSEIDQANMKIGALIAENLYRPIQMMVLDPAIGFTAIYTALVYGIFYSFFEAFPEVYIGFYGFNLGEMGLTFLSITVGVILAISCYWAYVYYVVEPFIRSNGLGPPERRLIPALVSSFFCPVGLFLFGWTANKDIHWIVPTIGITIFTIGIFIVIQCIFLFLPLTYPQYAASLFAGNDFIRSTLAAGAVHFSRPLYVNLGIGRGSSILGGLCCGCIFGVYALYWYGATLRARSKFAAK